MKGFYLGLAGILLSICCTAQQEVFNSEAVKVILPSGTVKADDALLKAQWLKNNEDEIQWKVADLITGDSYKLANIIIRIMDINGVQTIDFLKIKKDDSDEVHRHREGSKPEYSSDIIEVNHVDVLLINNIFRSSNTGRYYFYCSNPRSHTAYRGEVLYDLNEQEDARKAIHDIIKETTFKK
jgi:hypothetical protein